MLDFSSSLYLGLHHPSRSLAPWDRLTTGVPAALGELPAAGRVAGALAQLQGCERAVLARSTLHAFLDCFATLGGRDRPVLVDAGAYPIAGWAAGALGRPVLRFGHHDPADLGWRLRHLRRPLVVCDGFCPGCGAVAPLAGYLELAGRHDGLLLVDDTQALGVLGRRDRPGPYGAGGGGSPAWAGVGGPRVVVVASLAKGLGAPLAVAAGAAGPLGRLADAGPTRVHSSPPSAADLHAALRALDANRRVGEARRERLGALVARLRRRLAEQGVAVGGGRFPVQSLPPMAPPAAAALADALADRRVRAVLQRPRCRPGATVTLLVNADHTADQVDRVAAALVGSLGATGRREGAQRAG
jgi:8-amino-7-oxononanoate synthase